MKKHLLPLLLFLTWPLTHAIAKEIPTDIQYEILGWSDNEKYWAFGESGDYSGGAMGGKTVRYFVIDADKNSFAKKWEKRITEDQGYETEEAVAREEKKFRAAVQTEIKKLLPNSQTGIEAYKKPVAVWVEHDSEIKQFGEKEISFKLDDSQYEIKLEETVHSKKDDPWATKSGFKISIRKNAGPWKILQADKTPWRSSLSHRIVYVSIAPSKKKIAILVEAIEASFESAKTPYYKGITGALP